MKKIILSLSMLAAAGASAQNTGIGTTNPNATLEVKGNAGNAATPDGIIPPQLTRQQLIGKTTANAYGANQKGAMVYVTDLSGTTNIPTAKVDKAGFYYWDGTAWQKAGGDDWSLTGNAGTDPTVNFIGTTDDKDVIIKRNSTLAGIIQPFSTFIGAGAGNTAMAPAANNGSNSAFGATALYSITTGYDNIAIGKQAMYSLTTGVYNIGIGDNILQSFKTGDGNVAIGHSTGSNLNNNFGNTLVGSGNAQKLAGNANTVVGSQTLMTNSAISGDYNTVLGADAGHAFLGGSKNILIGQRAELPQNPGSNQLSIGNSIYGLNINDNNATNDLIGISATDPSERLDVNGNIKSRTINSNAGAATDKVVVADTSGILKSVARGGVDTNAWQLTGNSITAGQFIGTTNDQDVVIKRNNFESGRISNNNTSYGYQSNQNNIGRYNTLFGLQTMSNSTSGDYNTFIGTGAGQYINGSRNVGIGYAAANGASKLGDDNVYIGWQAGSSGSGARNIIIGSQFNSYDGSSNNIFIGYQTQAAVGKSNYLTIGNSIFGLNINDGDNTNDLIGIKNANPRETLDVAGTVKIGTKAAYSASTITAGATTPVPDGGAGTIVFQNSHFFGWDGSTWKQLDN